MRNTKFASGNELNGKCIIVYLGRPTVDTINTIVSNNNEDDEKLSNTWKYAEIPDTSFSLQYRWLRYSRSRLIRTAES